MLGWQWRPEQVDLCRREAHELTLPSLRPLFPARGMVRLSSGPLGGR
jgi:hypothetical protein